MNNFGNSYPGFCLPACPWCLMYLKIQHTKNIEDIYLYYCVPMFHEMHIVCGWDSATVYENNNLTQERLLPTYNCSHKQFLVPTTPPIPIRVSLTHLSCSHISLHNRLIIVFYYFCYFVVSYFCFACTYILIYLVKFAVVFQSANCTKANLL